MHAILRKSVIFILTVLARLALKKYGPTVVAVSGSVGKTSTKDALFTALAGHVRARKSSKSFNSEIGVPLTVLGLPNAWNSPMKWLENILDAVSLVVRTVDDYPDWLVLEVGADHPGDIKRTAPWLKPHYVVYTRFPEVPAHIEHFSSREEVWEEKRALRRALRETGTLVINADDPILREEPVRDAQKRLTYGFSPDADIIGTGAAIAYEDGVPIGVRCRVSYQKNAEDVVVRGVLGLHHLYPILAATAVCVSEGFRFADVVRVLCSHATPPGRMRIIEGTRGTLIDDTYNASPVAVEEALATLEMIRVPGKKYVVLGDMLELGEYSFDAHQAVGVKAAAVATEACFVGVRMRDAAESARLAGMPSDHIHLFQDAETAGDYLAQAMAQGDVALIKGSQAMRLERVVKRCMREPDQAAALLVRQDPEWLAR